MPCYDSRNDLSSGEREALQILRQDYRHNSDVAEMLCFLCGLIEKQGDMKKYPLTIQHWWAYHKERDNKKNP